jgi:1-acyl-sn-glycerol-3-phosphate acyltransferase
MIKSWIQTAVQEVALPDQLRKKLENAPVQLGSTGVDPWGLDPETAKTSAALLHWLYRDYFRVETTGLESLPKGRCLVYANHSGQIPIDGLLLGMALYFDANPSRIARGMVERWAPSLPFISSLLSRLGTVVGDPVNARALLNSDQCILVFPEGLRGIGKSITKRYELQKFGTGFVRLALETQTPIVPAAVIGCEEAYPGIAHLHKLAKMINAPYIPITPFFPFLGVFGMIPLPTKVTIRFGQPIIFKGDPEAPERELAPLVETARAALKKEIDEGLRIRGNHIFTRAGK